MNEKQEAPTHLLGERSAENQTPVADLRALPGRGLFAIFAHLLRPALTTALALPVLWGIALAHWHGTALNGWSITLLLLANGAFCIGLTLAGQYVDFRRTLADDWIRPDGDLNVTEKNEAHPPVQDVFLLLQTRRVRAGTVRSVVMLCLWICLLSYIWLSQLISWPLLFFGVLSILLAVVPLLPSIRFSRWFWLLGDLATLLAVGVLPVLSAYYAQREMIDRWVLLAAITPATLSWLTFMTYNLFSWRRDWRLRRGTAITSFGAELALDGAAVMGVAAFTSVLLLMALDALPLSSLLVLGALPLFLRAFTRNNRLTVTFATASYIIDRSTQATILTGLLWMLALWNG